MAEDIDVPHKKGRDPILMIGTIVLVLAFVVVISGYVYGQFTSESKEPAKFGDRVKVDYIGSYYGYYDEQGSQVFDTSYWLVADGDFDYSWEFNKKEEKAYIPFNVTIGSNGALKDFENVLIGMKPGDTARIAIPDAYGEVPAAKNKTWGKTMDGFKVTEKMSIDTFKATFGLDNAFVGSYADLEHPYGWMSNAVCDSNGIVTVVHLVENKEYKMNDDVKATVTLNGDGTFKMVLDITQETGIHDDLKLIEFKFDGQTYYITEVSATEFKTKSTEEKVGMVLYFEITFVGYQ